MYVIARSPQQKPLSFFFALNSSCIRDSLRKLLFFLYTKSSTLLLFSLSVVIVVFIIIVAP